jgi:hypothetical protein
MVHVDIKQAPEVLVEDYDDLPYEDSEGSMDTVSLDA